MQYIKALKARKVSMQLTRTEETGDQEMESFSVSQKKKEMFWIFPVLRIITLTTTSNVKIFKVILKMSMAS